MVDVPSHPPRTPDMPATVPIIDIRELRRTLLHCLSAETRIRGFLQDLRVCEAEAVEFQGFGVVFWVLHKCANGRAGPVADFEPGAVGEGEGLEGVATGAHYGGVVISIRGKIR